MAIILNPKRWTTQPPPGAQINFGHSLAKGLTAYILFNAGAGVQNALLPLNLPANVVGTPPTPRWKSGGSGAGGVGQYFDGNYGLWYERGAWFEPANAVTVVCRKRRIGTIANQDTAAIIKPQNNQGSTPYLSYRLNTNPSISAGQDKVSFDVATNVGSPPYHIGNAYDAGSGATLLEHTHGGSYISGSLRVWYNGIPRTNDSFTGSLTYDTTSSGRFLAANESSAGALNPYPGVIYWAGVWNRLLSGAEMEWLHVEPYAMLVPNRQRRSFSGPVGRTYTFYIAAEKIV